MIGRVLLDNENWLVTFGLLRAKVMLKNRRLTRKASREESRYLVNVLDELKLRGVPIEPGNDYVNYVLDSFAYAIFGGDARWQVFFALKTPKGFAEMLLETQESV